LECQVKLTYPIFYGQKNNHYGCLHFCRRGTNGDATDFFDEDLKSPIGNYTTTLKTSSPFTVTKALAWNKYSITISHIHEAETQPVTIQEVGYFGKSAVDADNWAYHMFSRIVLDQPVKLDEGEQLITSYCLTCTVDDTVQHLENFGGLNGIYAEARYCPFIETIGTLEANEFNHNNQYHFAGKFPFPGVTENGITYYPHCDGNRDRDYTFPNRAFMFPQVYFYSNAYASQSGISSKENIVFGKKSSLIFPEYNDRQMKGDSGLIDLYSTQQMTPNSTYEFVDYDMTKNYRDIKLIMPLWNPDLTVDTNPSVDIYYIRARGMDYRLGHYVTTETEQEWVPTPITKNVHHKMVFTVRTTISTEDTDLLNGNLVPPEP